MLQFKYKQHHTNRSYEVFTGRQSHKDVSACVYVCVCARCVFSVLLWRRRPTFPVSDGADRAVAETLFVSMATASIPFLSDSIFCTAFLLMVLWI